MSSRSATRTIVIVGAGQLGVTFSILLDQWQSATAVRSPFRVCLIERGPEVLKGATRASWIDHATGLEYFKRGEVETARACIEGSVTKRLLLPKGIHDMPAPIRNQFFVSAESNRSKEVVFDEFYAQARRGQEVYRSIYDYVARTWTEAEAYMFRPGRFMRYVGRRAYFGVSGDHVTGGLRSAGGMSNMALDYAFKIASLKRAQRRGTVEAKCSTTVEKIQEYERNVVVTLRDGNGAVEIVNADIVILTAAHGITDLVKNVPGSDQSGSYHLNFMLHAHLPPTSDPVLQSDLASVNFVLQGRNGGMYACVVPPTASEPGLAAMFAPGYDGSYIDEYATNVHARPAIEWDDLIRSGDFPGRMAKVKAVLQRITRLNPFLHAAIDSVDPQRHRVTVGSVFNPHGEVRSLRRLIPPQTVLPKHRILTMTSPKWTTSELAALTLLQHVLLTSAPASALPTAPQGFGPYNVDVAAAAPALRLTDIRLSRTVAERYLESLGLTQRVLPEVNPLYDLPAA